MFLKSFKFTATVKHKRIVLIKSIRYSIVYIIRVLEKL